MVSPVKKELILINPRLSNFLFNFIQSKFAGNPVPYSLLTIAALTPKEYNTKIINQRQFWTNRNFTGGALVGITCLTAAVFEAYQLSDKFRRAGSRVVLGGPHVTALPEEALEHADSIVIGEAESVWGRVIKDFENGQLEKIYKGEPLEDFFTPAYDYFMRLDARVLSRAGIHIDRGCRYHCDFCSRISPWLRSIKIEQALGLVVRIKTNRRSIFVRKPQIKFNSDNIYSSPSYAKELFKKMIPLDIIWGGNSSIDIGFDEEALELAKASGCKGLLIGFETIYPKEYSKTSLKELQSVKDYKIAINNIKARGIKVGGSFILGLDEYSHFDYLKLLWFLMRSGLWISILTILTPIPGSALFDRLRKENRILTFDWRKYFFLVCVIKPKRTSVMAVYIWFWLIRTLSIFFMPYSLLIMVFFMVSWEMGGRVTRWLLYGF